MGRRGLAAGVALAVLGAVILAWSSPGGASPGPVGNDMSDGSPTASDLASALVGSGVTVSNATYSGANVAAGTFSAGGSSVGFDTGVVLSSGRVTPGDGSTGIEGPNDDDATGTNNGTPGDDQLSALAGANADPPQDLDTFDAAILEFDFVPQGSSINFSYVFASEEYNEFVNAQFNDVFAFYVNGNNCALVPGTSQAVSVDTINNGNPYGEDPDNPQFFRNNDLQDGGGSIDIEFDGLTTVLTCTASVNSGVDNHVKLAIADAGDEDYDSAVFLQGGSFTTQPPSGGSAGSTSTTLLTGGVPDTTTTTVLVGGGAQAGAGAPAPTVSDPTPEPGGAETVSGSGFGAAQPVTITFQPGGAVIGGATTDAGGAYSAVVAVPLSAAPGAGQIVVSGLNPGGQPATAVAGVTVEDVDCSDFRTRADAQRVFDANRSDPHQLDTDHDGVACETLPTTLPRTGSGVRLPAAGGMALIAVGLLLVAGVIVARNRSWIVTRD